MVDKDFAEETVIESIADRILNQFSQNCKIYEYYCRENILMMN